MQRRLSVIMAMDIVGYSRLMEADEAGTRARQKSIHAEIVDPAIAAAGGRIVKLMGDGILAEFAGPVDAVRCAVTMQSALAQRNAGAPPTLQQLHRIGINLGDVLHEEGDLFGDGVNIAARLEQMAEPGGICISGTVHDHLKANVDASYADLGEVRVKNISAPVRVFRVLPSGAAPPPSSRRNQGRFGSLVPVLAMLVLLAVIGAGGMRWWSSSGKPPVDDTVVSVLVMPFSNKSESGDQDYFATGISEDIATDLSKVTGLTVFAPGGRTAGSSVSVARSLAATYLLEGSMRRAEGNIRITARLVRSDTGAQVWAERYDRRVDDLFDIQDDIAGRVVSEISASLQPARRGYVPDIRAYDAFIAGRARRIPPTPSNLAAARASFDSAIALDPQFAGGHAGLASVLLLEAEAEPDPERAEDLVAQARSLAERAVALDPEFGPAWGSLAEVHYRQRDFDAMLDAVRVAVSKAPSDSLMRAYLGRYLAYAGRAAEGVEQVRQALRMSPDSLPLLFLLGAALRADGQHDAAVEALREHRVRLNGRVLPAPTTQLIAALAQSGVSDAALEEVALLTRTYPGYTLERALRTHAYRDADANAAFREALIRAGLLPAAP